MGLGCGVQVEVVGERVYIASGFSVCSVVFQFCLSLLLKKVTSYLTSKCLGVLI